ncbi:hypothetical protein EJ06DRAFT_531458 [Trichodelitschia bisporula]|uniref:Uncharacterized protein n=1 Tax=Trichodelitschia bisporula TaxID=703511 RepID=A0A6G1HTG6_9PEZI|nr:hypothetical protein EJ06DRAFT_531458 [Trichodelitschia bisporula]
MRSAAVAIHRDGSHPNPMAGEDDSNMSVLKRYEHLLPPSCASINSLNQHLFLVNVNILFHDHDPTTLRLTVAHTGDVSLNPSTGVPEPRDLYYAALLAVPPPPATPTGPNTSSTPSPPDPAPGANGHLKVLLTGPAVPYFPNNSMRAASSSMLKKNGASNGAYFSSGTGARHIDIEHELRDTKEKAVSLLMSKLEQEIHEGISSAGGHLEIWPARGWKYAPDLGPPVREGSEKSRRGSGSGNGWFSPGSASVFNKIHW